MFCSKILSNVRFSIVVVVVVVIITIIIIIKIIEERNSLKYRHDGDTNAV